MVTKSNLILGMGEERAEISQALRDLHEAGCELITITQYLRPTPRHHPAERWVKPEEFVELRDADDPPPFRLRHDRHGGPREADRGKQVEVDRLLPGVGGLILERRGRRSARIAEQHVEPPKLFRDVVDELFGLRGN